MDNEQNDKKTMSPSRSNSSEEAIFDNSESTKVSSTAIVKYVEELPLLPYAKLRQDTNLNIAPSNWLRDGRFSKTFLQKRNPLDFSSFGIAHTFLDNIGDVDVISDAENIKKLLKMAYSKAELSLVVHRIGKTLLMDDLDLPALLSYISGNHVQSSDLRWLYEFYCEQSGIPKDGFFKKKKNKNDAKQKNIFSKFLHYSVQPEDNSSFSLTVEQEVPEETVSNFTTDGKDFEVNHMPPELTAGPSNMQDIPESRESSETLQPFVNNQASDKRLKNPQGETLNKTMFGHIAQAPMSFSERFGNNSPPSEIPEDDTLPEPQQMSPFQRNVLWKFEDLHMLVGTNVPIFGGGKYPAVSLRLRDCGKPINVLTGLDYWLDNLMCNVPEVAMCYHLDGIVQYYDLFKTEDLPQLEGSSFSPKVVKDIAQNVLSFMKANCTQEGHTYWLFKASDSEVVKLYDLTSICDQKAEKKYQNPFTIPVAMLFYRVAKNMMKQDELDAGDQSIVKLLLDNCVLLLDDQEFPEVITSANLLLSSLYSPDNIHTVHYSDGNGKQSKGGVQEELLANDSPNKSADAMASKGSLEVRKLSTPGMYQDDIRQVATMITSNTEERCKKALSHIVQGFRCLDLGSYIEREADEIDDIKNNPSKGSYSVRRITALDPSYSPPPARRGLDVGDKNPLILVKPVQWRAQSKVLLFRKAASVYHSLACLSNTKGKYGRALRYCKLSFKCLQVYRACLVRRQEDEFELIRSINCACADSYLMLSKCENLDLHNDDFINGSTDDSFIAQAAEESSDGTYGTKVEFKFDAKENLMTSSELYELAMDQTAEGIKQDEFVTLARRVGNVKNELGVYFMNEAVSMAEQGTKLFQQRGVWKKSFAFFESGIKAFESIDDRANMALLYSNCGRLMRLCAQAVGARLGTGEPHVNEFSSEEKAFFKQSIDFYNRALQSLAERKNCAEVWDAVTWELSGAYCGMATLLQDYPPLSILSQQEIEKEVTELMMKALKICEPTGKATVPTVRPLSSRDLQKRIGSIHHRLASLYHNAYRNEVSDHAKKKARTLADLHYAKACLYYQPWTFPCEWIRIRLEQVAMCEHQLASHALGSNVSVKALDTALEFILQCREALVTLSSKDEESSRNVEETEKERGQDSILESSAEVSNKNISRRTAKKDHDQAVYEDKPGKGAEESTSEKNGQHSKKNLETLSSTIESEQKFLIQILETRLKFVLKEMVKLRSSKKGGKNKDVNIPELEKAKRMYTVALKGCGTTNERNLPNVLDNIRSIRANNT